MKRTIVSRRRLLLAVLALVAGAAGCGGGSSAAAGDGSRATPGTWVVLGSSTAAGVGASPGNAWAALLAAAYAPHGVLLDNLARAGALTYQALPAAAHVPAGRPLPDPAINVDRALALKPTLLLLAFPTNDTLAGYAVQETVDNLLAMRARAAAAGVAAVVLSTQPRTATDAQIERLHQIDAALQPQLGACFVDVHAALADASGRIAAAYAAGDGVHLNDAGHRLVFDRVQAVLQGGRCVSVAPG